VSEPVQVKKRAIDVTPYEHGIWCSVEGGDPFVNTIVLRKWSEDGSQVVFMLDSHNFLFAKPDEEIEVVEASSTFYNAEFQAKRLAEDAKTMASKPVPKPPSEVEALRSQLSTLRGELEEARGERDRAVLDRDTIEARIVSTLDAAFAGPETPPLDMSHEVARIVNCVRIRERMLATATARAEAAEADRDKWRDAQIVKGQLVADEIGRIIRHAASDEREAIAAWLESKAKDGKWVETVCSSAELATAIRANHHADEAGEK